MKFESERIKSNVCIYCKHVLLPNDIYCSNCGKENIDLFIEYNLDFENRWKFYFEIWIKGAFQSDIMIAMPLVKRESIEDFVQIEHKRGFVTIIDLKNQSSKQQEKFFLISDENLSNIFLQICKHAQIYFNEIIQDVIQELMQLNEKDDFELPVLEEIPVSFGNDKRIDKVHSALLEKDHLYLLLRKQKTSPSIKRHEELNKFFTKAIVRIFQINSSEIFPFLF